MLFAYAVLAIMVLLLIWMISARVGHAKRSRSVSAEQEAFLNANGVTRTKDLVFEGDALETGGLEAMRCRAVFDDPARAVWVSSVNSGYKFVRIPYDELMGVRSYRNNVETGSVAGSILGGMAYGDYGAYKGATTGRYFLTSYRVVLARRNVSEPKFVFTLFEDTRIESTYDIVRRAEEFGEDLRMTVNAAMAASRPVDPPGAAGRGSRGRAGSRAVPSSVLRGTPVRADGSNGAVAGSGHTKAKDAVGALFGILIVVAFAFLFYSCQQLLDDGRSDSQLRSEMAIRSWNEKHKTPVPRTPDPYIVPSELDIPCVGMRESQINLTKHPKLLRKTTDSYVGRTHYVYYSDAVAAQNIPCTLSLQCIDGVVTEVNDYRDDPLPILHYKPKNKGYSGSKATDPYGDAEAFYYDHMDEFEDMDEAEEYYNEMFGSGS